MNISPLGARVDYLRGGVYRGADATEGAGGRLLPALPQTIRSCHAGLDPALNSASYPAPNSKRAPAPDSDLAPTPAPDSLTQELTDLGKIFPNR